MGARLRFRGYHRIQYARTVQIRAIKLLKWQQRVNDPNFRRASESYNAHRYPNTPLIQLKTPPKILKSIHHWLTPALAFSVGMSIPALRGDPQAADGWPRRPRPWAEYVGVHDWWEPFIRGNALEIKVSEAKFGQINREERPGWGWLWLNNLLEYLEKTESPIKVVMVVVKDRFEVSRAPPPSLAVPATAYC